MKLDSFKKRYSLGKLFLFVVLAVLTCKLLIKCLFLWCPGLHSTDIPLICSAMFIVLLSPTLYVFFYRPMLRQFELLKKSEVKMRDLAFKDLLTGLYNRRGFMTFSDQLLKLSNRSQRGLVLIYADLDNLKQINDDHGHEMGDKALASIAQVLRETFRDSDIIGRIGGDEFAVLAIEAKFESQDALRMRLKENLERILYNVDSVIKLTLSLGILYYDSDKPQTIDELLRKADVLMYEEKNLKSGILISR